MCFLSFKKIYERMHCLEPERNTPTSFHIYSAYGMHFRGIYGGCMYMYVSYTKSVASTMSPGGLNVLYKYEYGCHVANMSN